MDATDKIDLSNILKARDIFESFRQNMKTDRDKAGATQAFEFSYELSWRLLKRVLESQGYEVLSHKDTFRKGALAKLIDNPEIWFDFQKMRNLTVHTYREENLDLIVSSFDSFSKELNKLIEKLRSLL